MVKLARHEVKIVDSKEVAKSTEDLALDLKAILSGPQFKSAEEAIHATGLPMSEGLQVVTKMSLQGASTIIVPTADAPEGAFLKFNYRSATQSTRDFQGALRVILFSKEVEVFDGKPVNFGRYSQRLSQSELVVQRAAGRVKSEKGFYLISYYVGEDGVVYSRNADSPASLGVIKQNEAGKSVIGFAYNQKAKAKATLGWYFGATPHLADTSGAMTADEMEVSFV